MKTEAKSATTKMGVHFSTACIEWATPGILFEALDREFHFTLDPCATPQNSKCARFFTAVQDGLKQSWTRETVFMNPPYGRVIAAWVKKAFDSANAGATVVCLLPARTDTIWWHTFVMRGEIRFVRGRLRFGDARASAPFPSAIVIFRPSQFNPPDRTMEKGPMAQPTRHAKTITSITRKETL
jgi:phage N-6-adenine-methyltransferase